VNTGPADTLSGPEARHICQVDKFCSAKRLFFRSRVSENFVGAKFAAHTFQALLLLLLRPGSRGLCATLTLMGRDLRSPSELSYDFFDVLGAKPVPPLHLEVEYAPVRGRLP
jgi:hypothetical protein